MSHVLQIGYFYLIPLHHKIKKKKTHINFTLHETKFTKLYKKVINFLNFNYSLIFYRKIRAYLHKLLFVVDSKN